MSIPYDEIIVFNLSEIERKLRVPRIRGFKGEAIVNYCEPLVTKEMG
jgi:hypothetical protein